MNVCTHDESGALWFVLYGRVPAFSRGWVLGIWLVMRVVDFPRIFVDSFHIGAGFLIILKYAGRCTVHVARGHRFEDESFTKSNV